MNNALPAFLAALVGALLLTPVARRVAIRFGVVDRPDGKRKLQAKPVPLMGGVAVYLSLLVGLAVAVWTSPAGDGSMLSMSLLVGGVAGFVCLFGWIDDRYDLKPRTKLLLQIIATLPIVFGGYCVERTVLFGYPMELGWLGIPLTVLWLVACINALNLLDGMDGLASVVGLSIAAVMAFIAIHSAHGHVSVLAVVLAGSLIGFLAYNLPPASIYLGDSGSMVIGLVVGVLATQGAMTSSGTLSIMIPAAVMTIPLLDTTFAVIRRKLSGSRFDVADRGHIHHCLLKRGLSNWQALGVIAAMCVTTGGAAAAASIWQMEALAWVAAILVVVVLVRTRAFGNHEVALVRAAISGMTTRVAAQLTTQTSLQTSPAVADPNGPSFEFAWQQLIDEAAQLDAKSLELYRVAGGEDEIVRSWQATGSGTDVVAQWRVAIKTEGDASSSLELRTAGSGEDDSQSLSQLQLNRLLHNFGRDWATRSPELSINAADDTRASSEHIAVKKAA